jgi:hypothetical protein
MASSANQNKRINIFLLEKDGSKQRIGYIKHYIRDANGKPTNFSRNESNLLPFVPMNAGIIQTYLPTLGGNIGSFNSFLLDYIKKDIIHQRTYDLAIKQIFNVFFIDNTLYDVEIIGILFYKTQTTTHNIYFVYRKIKYTRDNTEKVNFLCYLVRCKNDDGGYPRLLEKDYSIEDAKNDLLEQIPIFYQKLSKISSGLLPRNNTNINRAFVNRSFGNNK